MNIPVFRAGLHTDMSGKTRQWTTEDLDRIISRYDPSMHEAPVVIGHPKNDSPAWGWVESLRRDGDLLMAGLKNVSPEFDGWVKDGRYKKRSICLYPDLTLRHIGFLGAMPPAVKGLPDCGFSEVENEIVIEFSEKENIMDLKEFFEGMKFWNEHQAKPAETVVQGTTMVSFSESELEAAKKEAAQKATEAERNRLTLEFAESARLAKQEARGEAIKAEVTQLIASGKVPPAWVKSGMVEFMSALDAETEIQFAEGADKQNQLAWFRQFLAELPKVIHFGEIAGRDKDVSGDPEGKLTALIQKKMTDNKNLTYSAAFAEVQLENKDLVAEYIGR